ncbi:MAG TPA: glycoside hydrolase, partial [Chloroflexota bacterium]|nr:glycoside hydrolase [Chloroflexota bacterium]
MARIKLAYIGGGSTRAPGTIASFIKQGQNFNGSEVVLIDLDAERLAVVRTLAQRLVKAQELDLTISASTDRRAGLVDCDAVLTSFRPGGFEARALDERIPLKHGVIGQETQGPGGFFMALRSIQAMRSIVAEMEAVCPRARLFNYTNPVNLVAEALTHHTFIPSISLCEGPIYTPYELIRAAGLDDQQPVDAVFIGLNHASWSTRHQYAGQDLLPLLREAYRRKQREGDTTSHGF